MSDLIERFAQHLRAGGQSDRTVQVRRDILRCCDRALPGGLDQASAAELAELLSRYSGWTLYTYNITLRVFYRWAVGGAWLGWDPTTALLRPRAPRPRPDPVSDDELGLALARSDDRWRTVILLAALAGLRAAEIAGLRREDVTCDLIVIRRAKGGDLQAVPTAAALWRRLQLLPAGPVVTDRRGRALSPIYLPKAARGHFDRIRLPTVHLHRFRHWFATTLLRAGVDLRTVQELMRHTSVASTQAYTLVTATVRRAAVDALPDVTAGFLPVFLPAGRPGLGVA